MPADVEVRADNVGITDDVGTIDDSFLAGHVWVAIDVARTDDGGEDNVIANSGVANVGATDDVVEGLEFGATGGFFAALLLLVLSIPSSSLWWWFSILLEVLNHQQRFNRRMSLTLIRVGNITSSTPGGPTSR